MSEASREQSVLLCRWNGPNLFDTVEDEAMTLTMRAVYRVACEAVSLVRNYYRPRRLRDSPPPYIREPIQDDAWVTFTIPLESRVIDCCVNWVPEGDESRYAFQFSEPRGCLGSLLTRKRPLPATLKLVIEQSFSESKLIAVDRWLSDAEFQAMV